MKYLLLIALFVGVSAEAKIFRENFQGVRATGMGNAFIALADDGNMLWYNPAGLTQVRGFHLDLFDFTLGFDSIETLNRIKNLIFGGDSASLIAEDLTFLRGQYKLVGLTRYFGAGFFMNNQGFWQISNLQLPDVDIYAFSDIGLIAGVGLPVSKFLSIGASVRAFQRTGVDANITTLDLLSSLGGITQEDFMNAIYDQLKRMSGSGYGLGINLGALARIPIGKGKEDPEIRLAATIDDFGGTSFYPLGTEQAPSAMSSSYNFGMALVYNLSKTSTLNIAGELRHYFDDAPLIKKSHLGIEYRHKRFAFRGGLHQGYLTYGASFEALPHTRVHFSSYGVELNDSGQLSHRWYLMQVIIGFNPF